MKIAIMQPYFLPYIGYFQLINAVDKFIVLDDVCFINKGWINRNRILIKERPYLFTVPLNEASQNRLIKDIEIFDDGKWRKKLIRSIELNYTRAPFFNEAFPLVKKIILQNNKSISNFILKSILAINSFLEIKTSIVGSSSIYNNHHFKGEDRILDICKKEKASEYVNLIGGLDLYSKVKFNKEKIKIHFLRSKSIYYKQFLNDFIPSLSIIDVMMFNIKEDIKKMLKLYDLE